MKFNPKSEAVLGSSLVRRLVEASEATPSRFEFRPSRLPYCAIQHLWYSLSERAKRTPQRHETFLSSFYTHVGTGIHNAVQEWLGRMGVLYGYWRCTRAVDALLEPSSHFSCDALDLLGPSFLPGVCPRCGSRLRYEEVKLLDPESGFKGHCDGLLRFPEIKQSENQFVLLEVKSTQSTKLKDLTSTGGVYRQYILQVSMYAHMLRRQGYDIQGVMFLFVPRDKPRKITPVWQSQVVAFSEASFRSTVGAYQATIKAIATTDYKEARGTCMAPADAIDCPFRAACFNADPEGHFQDLHRQATKKSPLSLPVFPPKPAGVVGVL